MLGVEAAEAGRGHSSACDRTTMRGGETMNEAKAREIAIAILDEFEELLAAKGVMIPSEDQKGNLSAIAEPSARSRAYGPFRGVPLCDSRASHAR